MIIEIKIPSPGESITEVELATWFVENGSIVSKDTELGEVESEKATLPLIADKGGKVELLASEGDTLEVGSVACKIDTSVEAPAAKEEQSTAAGKEASADEDNATANQVTEPEKDPAEAEVASVKAKPDKAQSTAAGESMIKATPVAKKMMEEAGLDVEDIIKGLRKITASDVKAVKESGSARTEDFTRSEISREENRSSMSQLRKKVSERLVAVKNETAMLTTFNEADMSAVMQLRKKYQDRFVDKHGVKLGFMSFFTKAVTLALQEFPNVNSYLDGDEVVTPAYCDIGIAVQTDKGLMVPVIRNTETLGLGDIEKQIMDIAGRARKNRITMDELSGGTFTITNGGIFGSMLSTPILNPPQSAILGMHNIVERPVAENGQVVIRPMMYLALSYDHRIIDGRDSVGFLKTVKAYIEDPASMLFGAGDPASKLLDI